MEYQILESETADSLGEKVNAAIGSGWKPLGGVAVTAVHRTWENSRKGHEESETDWLYTQAITREGSA